MSEVDTHIQVLVQDLGIGAISASAYDTAWAARLHNLDAALADQALEWVCEHQLPDGSWGASEPLYFHERVICTLAALTALYQRGRRAFDHKRRERGMLALEIMLEGLAADAAGATVGFELILPTLMAEARYFGMRFVGHERLLSRLERQRAAKLASLPGNVINRLYTPAHSLEMVGADELRLIDQENLLGPNGSVGGSPAATIFALLHLHLAPAALHYVQGVARNGVLPTVATIDVFEIAWSLWNLALPGLPTPLPEPFRRALNFLRATWRAEVGIAPIAAYAFVDGDTTALVYETLARYGQPLDIEALLQFETTDHFRCLPLEANPSLSTNVHVLGALLHAGFLPTAPAVQKVVRFLRAHRTLSYWHDKWHVSPYYTTAHAIINCWEVAPDLADAAIEWMLATQHPNGAWGYYLPTAEETAYCLQALLQTHSIAGERLQRAVTWLEAHQDLPYPPLWIGKVLYCPQLVVRSAILSALKLAGR